MTKGIIFKDEDPLADLKRHSTFVIGQLGQSLDGRIATHTGDSKYINHRQGLHHLHRLRALVDAVIVGVGTVNDDDPSLTVRLCEGQSPKRVIIDPKGRVFKNAKLFSDKGPQVIIITSNRISHPLEGKVQFIKLPEKQGRLEPQEILETLHKQRLHKILIEGGSRTLSSFIDEDLIDNLHLIVAPMLIGSGYSGLNLKAVSMVQKALRPEVSLYSLGCDVLFDCNLRKSCRESD